MITSILLIAIVAVAIYVFGLFKNACIATVMMIVLGVWYYATLLTTGVYRSFFYNDPYSGIYPNLWERALSGNFNIDPSVAFREYFINEEGVPTVYFGFMPALIRGVGSIFNSNIYTYNLGNLSIIIAFVLALSALLFSAKKLDLFKNQRVGRYALTVFTALIFASPLSYLAVWGRIHSEVIMWSAAWGLIFVAFFALWIFGAQKQQKWQYGVVMGLAVGFALMTRPTVALTLIIPFGAVLVYAAYLRFKDPADRQLKLLIPGVVCAIVLGLFVMHINNQRWGNPFTFVEMDRHVELLNENPQRGADLREAGEFNGNRIPHSIQYYFMPTPDNFSKEAPFVEIDQRLSLMEGAPQYDYIEGSRIPVTISMTFLGVISILGLLKVRSLKPSEKYLSLTVVGGGIVTAVALCVVYALALRYSVDLLPAMIFLCIVYLRSVPQTLEHKSIWRFILAAIFVVSIFMTVLTTLQYKVVSGQIDLSPEFRTNLSHKLNFAPEKDAKIFIINGVPSPAVPYDY